jgi:hypothetical protein
MLIKNLPEGVHFLNMSQENVGIIWYYFQGANGVFDDATKGDIRLFLSKLLQKDSIWLELDDGMGILYATEIIPTLSANVHIAFWDHKLKERYALIVQCLAWLINTCELEKINASLPVFTYAARKHVEALGFKEEGVIRRFSRSDGRLYNQHLYGILKEDILTHSLLMSIL